MTRQLTTNDASSSPLVLDLVRTVLSLLPRSLNPNPPTLKKHGTAEEDKERKDVRAQSSAVPYPRDDWVSNLPLPLLPG